MACDKRFSSVNSCLDRLQKRNNKLLNDKIHLLSKKKTKKKLQLTLFSYDDRKRKTSYLIDFFGIIIETREKNFRRLSFYAI